jgi:hypothetical protein
MNYKKIAKVAYECETKKRIIDSLYGFTKNNYINEFKMQKILDEIIETEEHELQLMKQNLVVLINN